MRLHAREYAFRPGLRLRLLGERGALRHFDAEYGRIAAREAGDARQVEVVFGDATIHDQHVVISGGHKTVGWDVALAPPDAEPLHAAIAVRGRPRSFVLSLVQGYFVEPLLSVAAARCGYVLLPSAGIASDGEALVLMGRSRSGKSSLSVRALAAGKRLLGDDQIVVDASARCWLFPRRMRFYSDLPQTAPAAYARLPRATRAALVARRVAVRATGGFVSPPVRVAPEELGPRAEEFPRNMSRAVVIERAAAVTLEETELETHRAVELALELLDEQRAKIRAGGGRPWEDALEEIRMREAEILSAALARTTVTRLAVPAAWPAAEAIGALAERLGTER